jgi:hypothetical protein
MVAGVTRMTSECLFCPYVSYSQLSIVSLVVILFEVRISILFNRWRARWFPHLQLTGAISHVLPIMISVMTSKWVGDAFGKDGIYAVWIAMRRYPWVPMADYHDRGETGALLMTPFSELVVIQDEASTVAGISASITSRNCLTCLSRNRTITPRA